jgi:hypothetical protein
MLKHLIYISVWPHCKWRKYVLSLQYTMFLFLHSERNYVESRIMRSVFQSKSTYVMHCYMWTTPIFEYNGDNVSPSVMIYLPGTGRSSFWFGSARYVLDNDLLSNWGLRCRRGTGWSCRNVAISVGPYFRVPPTSLVASSTTDKTEIMCSQKCTVVWERLSFTASIFALCA